MSWTGWGRQKGERTSFLEVTREQNENKGRESEMPVESDCLAGERARHGRAQPECDNEDEASLLQESGKDAIESSQQGKSQEEEDLALALTLQAVEEEELLLAQEQYARQLESSKRTAFEKIRVVVPGAASEGGRTGGSALAYTKSVEAAEKMLEKSNKDYRS